MALAGLRPGGVFFSFPFFFRQRWFLPDFLDFSPLLGQPLKPQPEAFKTFFFALEISRPFSALGLSHGFLPSRRRRGYSPGAVGIFLAASPASQIHARRPKSHALFFRVLRGFSYFPPFSAAYSLILLGRCAGRDPSLSASPRIGFGFGEEAALLHLSQSFNGFSPQLFAAVRMFSSFLVRRRAKFLSSRGAVVSVYAVAFFFFQSSWSQQSTGG